MALTYRRLLPDTGTGTDSESPAPSSSQSPSPSPSPSPAQASSAAANCLFPCNGLFCRTICRQPYFSPPPPPPSPIHPPWFPSPPPYGGSGHLSVGAIIAVSVVSSVFFLVVYLLVLSRWRRNRNIRNNGPRQQSPPDDDRSEEEFNNNQAIFHPIWLINTVGLQPSVISAITVCEYKKGEGLIEGDYCSICLSEFEEDESVRLLPKCSHAFHIPCIDTWLRSHTNCPLCRAPILSQALPSGSVAVLEPVETDMSEHGGVEDQGENSGDGDTVGDGAGDSNGAAEGGNSGEGVNDKSVVEEEVISILVGRRSVSMDADESATVNEGREGNRRGGGGGAVRSLSCSARFFLPGSDSRG